MKNKLLQIKKYWERHFLNEPNNLKALRITVSALFCMFLFYYIGFKTYGLIVGMGIVAAALIENDIHVKSAVRSTAIITTLFFVFASLTSLLLPYTIIFCVFLVLSTFLLTLMGSFGSKYASLGFGSVLIIIYTLIIDDKNSSWYVVPVLFSVGVLVYMISTILVIWFNPFRNLQVEISEGYKMLGKYLKTKARFFPSTSQEQELIRNELALINIELFSQTEKIKNLLIAYNKVVEIENNKTLKAYTLQWNKLQSLHERAVSSHEPYDWISQDNKDIQLVKGFGKFMVELGEALQRYSISILNSTVYHNTTDLLWTQNALQMLVDKYRHPTQEYILYLYKNISSIASELENISTHENILGLEEPSRIKQEELFSVQNPKLRHAIRLSLCFLIGYLLISNVQLEVGAWVLLTSLIVCQQTYNATRQKFFRRVIGTLLGVVLGYVLAILLPTTIGQMVVLIGSMYLFFKYLRYNYIIAAVFITVYVVAVYNLQNGSGTAMILPRILATLLGSVIAYLSIRFIWPEWQYKNLKPLIVKAIERNRRYLIGVMTKDITDDIYAHNQRSAHRADNALTEVWKSMRLEPQSKRKMLTSARNFTYLNHTLLSYISAMGAHRKHLSFDTEDFQQQQKILDTLDAVIVYIVQEKIQGPKDEAIPQSKDTPYPKKELGNQMFLKNILQVSYQMKRAVQDLRFK